MAKSVQVGDYVAVKRCALATLPSLASFRGTVESIEGGWLATVVSRAGERRNLNVGNLCGVRSAAFID